MKIGDRVKLATDKFGVKGAEGIVTELIQKESSEGIEKLVKFKRDKDAFNSHITVPEDFVEVAELYEVNSPVNK